MQSRDVKGMDRGMKRMLHKGRGGGGKRRIDRVRKEREMSRAKWEKVSERLPSPSPTQFVCLLRGSCVGDYKPMLFSVTPGLHTRPDLIYVPNICLRRHKHAGTRAYQRLAWPLHMQLVSRAISPHVLFTDTLILWVRSVRHNMPTPLKQDNWSGGGGNWMRRGHVHVCQYEFKSECRPRLHTTSPIPSATPAPPCCFNRLLLWQSPGICLQKKI